MVLSLSACTKNICVIMDRQPVSDEIEYELSWGAAFPINYFAYKPLTRLWFKCRDESRSVQDIEIISVEVNIEELNVYQRFSNSDEIHINKNDKSMDLYLSNCFSEIIQETKDLKIFNNIELVTVKINFKDNEIIKNTNFYFHPSVQESYKLLDNLMSV